jgi:acetylornithine deacetylase
MSLLPQFKEMALDFPIHFAFSYDEEVGCTGVLSLIDNLVAKDYQPRACLVGEPTAMKPVIGHKGKYTYRCQVHGAAAHSSLTNQGCNAIEHGAGLIHYLRTLANTYKNQGIQDPDFDVPYTTLTTNLIKGGNAQNTIPNFCEFIFEFRNLPQDDSAKLHQQIVNYVNQDLLANLQSESPTAQVNLEVISKAPGLNIGIDDPLVQAAQQISQVSQLTKVAYATEAGLFQQAGVPTIVCGPGHIDQAHRANEYVAIAQLNQCEQFIRDLLSASFLRKSKDLSPTHHD